MDNDHAAEMAVWRERRKLKQSEAATFLGVTSRTLRRIEAGETKISDAVRARMDAPIADQLPKPEKPARKKAAPTVAQVEKPRLPPIIKAKPLPSVGTKVRGLNGEAIGDGAAPKADPRKLVERIGDLEIRTDVPPDGKNPIYMGQLHPKLPEPIDIGPAIRAMLGNTSIAPTGRDAARAVIKRAELERLSLIEVHPDGFRVPSNILGLTANGEPCFTRKIHEPPETYANGAIVRETHIYRARNGHGVPSVKLIGTPAKTPLPASEGFYPVADGAYSPVNYAEGANSPHAAMKAGEAKRRQSDSART